MDSSAQWWSYSASPPAVRTPGASATRHSQHADTCIEDRDSPRRGMSGRSTTLVGALVLPRAMRLWSSRVGMRWRSVAIVASGDRSRLSR